MIISLIVAITQNDVIGNKGQIPWRLPAEQAIFKQTTMGHPIIMGRRTHESIGRPLPGRTNIVITRQKNYQVAGCIVAGSVEQAIREAERAEGGEKVFIIGGEEIYKQAMPMVDRIYLTRVHADLKGDTFFKFDESEWQEIAREAHNADDNNQYNYEFIVLKRKN